MSTSFADLDAVGKFEALCKGRRATCTICGRTVAYATLAAHRRTNTCRIIGLRTLIAAKQQELWQLLEKAPGKMVAPGALRNDAGVQQ